MLITYICNLVAQNIVYLNITSQLDDYYKFIRFSLYIKNIILNNTTNYKEELTS